jgi:hypothetical protein
MADDILVKEGYMYGEWRKAVNFAELHGTPGFPGVEQPRQPSTVGSIHVEEVAKNVGMRGAVVAGTMHLDLFPPVLSKAFGQKCFESGSISMYYTYAVLHGEELRAVVKAPPKGARDVQVEARLELRDGHVVAQGTVSAGNPKEKSYVQAMELKSSPREERRILKGLEVGDEMPPRDELVESAVQRKWAPFLEDSLDWYSGKSPWGNAIVPPSRQMQMMRFELPVHPPGVGFFGSTEIRYVNGPVKTDITYQAKSKIIAVGVTSKTEYWWIDSQLYEKASNKLIAQMRHMTRYMKAGSPLYPEVK